MSDNILSSLSHIECFSQDTWVLLYVYALMECLLYGAVYYTAPDDNIGTDRF